MRDARGLWLWQGTRAEGCWPPQLSVDRAKAGLWDGEWQHNLSRYFCRACRGTAGSWLRASPGWSDCEHHVLPCLLLVAAPALVASFCMGSGVSVAPFRQPSPAYIKEAFCLISTLE